MGTPKFLKLLADFIRIIQKSNKSEIKKSIEIAQDWFLISQYREMLSHSLTLIPEIDFVGINNEKSSLIEIVTDKVCNTYNEI